jgi:hypothetical protein
MSRRALRRIAYVLMALGLIVYFEVIRPRMSATYHPSPQLLTTLEYATLETEGLPRSGVEGYLTGCVDACMHHAPKDRCETACVCVENALLHTLSRDDWTQLLATTNTPVALQVQIDKAQNECLSHL